jgi:hypothetical protein
VSEAYQDLVRRNWLTRRHGRRLTVGANSGANLRVHPSLDELINESIQRAKDLGYSLQALRERVRERLLAQPPDHILVVEEESGLRSIIQQEVRGELGWPVETCSWEQFANEPGLGIGAQVLAPNHIVGDLKPLIPQSRPPVAIAYSRADEQVDLIRNLKSPSIVAVASVSESLLKTARSLLAPAIARKHTFQEFLLSSTDPIKLNGVDLAFCDSLSLPLVSCRYKVHYQLIDVACLKYLGASLNL